MRSDKRLWRTGDGRLVADGDPDAATLAYTPGDDIAPRDESLVPHDEPDTLGGVAADDTEAKARTAPANKARVRAADK